MISSVFVIGIALSVENGSALKESTIATLNPTRQEDENGETA